MKRFGLLISLAVVGAMAAPAGAAAKTASKPSAPTITSVTSGQVKNGKVNITVTFTLSKDTGGPAIKRTKVSAGGKSCTATKSKTSCTIRGLKNGKVVNVTAKSENKKGYGKKSAVVRYKVGSTPDSKSPRTYKLGDRGPGGGIVFMLPDSQGGLGGNYYYEAAKSNWFNSGSDPKRLWCNDTSRTIGSVSTAIGSGAANTQLMVRYCASGAGQLAAAYSSGGFSNWFLPSRDELEQLYLNGYGIGGFVAGGYWSSSERDEFAWGQNFEEGFQFGSGSKGSPLYVRPIRMFK